MEIKTEFGVEVEWADGTIQLDARPSDKSADTMVEFVSSKLKYGTINRVTKKKRTITIGEWEDA